MTKITLLGDSLLLKKIEVKSNPFDAVGAAGKDIAMFTVCFAGPSAPVKAKDTVILKPGDYNNQIIEGKTYLFAEGSQIAGKVTLGAK